MSICFNNKIDIKSLNIIKNELFKNCLVYLGFDYEQQIVKPEQTNKQRDREFNYRGHSYPLWIVGVSGPIYNKGCILKPIYFRINNCSDTVFLPPVSTLSPSFYPLSFPISVSLISRSVLLDPMETVSVRLV